MNYINLFIFPYFIELLRYYCDNMNNNNMRDNMFICYK